MRRGCFRSRLPSPAPYLTPTLLLPLLLPYSCLTPTSLPPCSHLTYLRLASPASSLPHLPPPHLTYLLLTSPASSSSHLPPSAPGGPRSAPPSSSGSPSSRSPSSRSRSSRSRSSRGRRARRPGSAQGAPSSRVESLRVASEHLAILGRRAGELLSSLSQVPLLTYAASKLSIPNLPYLSSTAFITASLRTRASVNYRNGACLSAACRPVDLAAPSYVWCGRDRALLFTAARPPEPHLTEF